MVHCRGEALTGEGLIAWEQYAPHIVPDLEANGVALLEALARAADETGEAA